MQSSFIDLFTEKPYAAALSSNFLRSHCSNCFASAITGCKGCSSVVYCNKECQKPDWPWHKAECKAFAERKKKTTKKDDDYEKDENVDEEFIRILARVLVRKRKDQGSVVLSEMVPEFVKNRCFDDLMSHVEDFDTKLMNDLVARFRIFFAGNESLEKIGDDDLRSTLGRIMINDFSISGQPTDRGTFASLGIGLYLNASRFDHSCDRNADLIADFDGSIIRIRLVVDENDESIKVGDLVPKTEQEFNRLTISYGFGQHIWTAVPWIQQRRDSLRTDYFFECRCRRCENQLDAVLSWDASSRECPTCRKPYVLDGTRPGCLIPTCECKLDKKKKKLLTAWRDDENAKSDCEKLEEQWSDVMNRCIETQSAFEAVSVGEPVRTLASVYWHPVFNLRFTQLNELLFAAYRALALSSFTDHWLFTDEMTPMVPYRFDVPLAAPPSKSHSAADVSTDDRDYISECSKTSLRMSLKIGETLLRAFEYYLPDHDYHFIIHCAYLGELFELASNLPFGCGVFQAQSIQYYEMALDRWLRRQWKGSEKCIDQLRYRLERVRGPEIIIIPSTPGADIEEVDKNVFEKMKDVAIENVDKKDFDKPKDVYIENVDKNVFEKPKPVVVKREKEKQD